jgi:hypothetical protein
VKAALGMSSMCMHVSHVPEPALHVLSAAGTLCCSFAAHAAPLSNTRVLTAALHMLWWHGPLPTPTGPTTRTAVRDRAGQAQGLAA